MIATGAFPLSAALTPDGSDDFIAGEGGRLPVSVLFNFGIMARGNQGSDGCSLFGRSQEVEDLAFVIAAIGAHHITGAWT